MVSQFTAQQQQAPPQAASPSLSPAQWAQLSQLIQSQSQQGYQPQAAPPSTSAYTSDGTFAGIDPAMLQAQWLQHQRSQLSQSAIIPQTPQYALQYQQTPQYAPQQAQGLSQSDQYALIEHYEVSQKAAKAAKDYILYLEDAMIEHFMLMIHSSKQDQLIKKFLFDRDFALQYARYGWVQEPITDRFASGLADAYLEIAALSPYQQSQQHRDPQFTGNPNPTFVAQLQPTMQPQNFIPPLPSSNGNASNGITLDQYLTAQQQGLAGAARAAALQNPASLYASLFQQ